MGDLIRSPMNYIGGKYKLLPELLPLFPEPIDKFCDLFCGGLNVGINIDANVIYANDQIQYIIYLYEIFKTSSIDSIISYINNRISEYELSDINREGYEKFREEYNRSRKPLDLFVLLCYSFNNQLRFNSDHDFNMPFGEGRSKFNDSIRYNLIQFCNELKRKDFRLSTLDFREFDFSNFGSDDFVYCDPPYLITTGTYNDGKRGFNGWSEKDDIDLMNLLDDLNTKNVKFAMSNVIYHMGNSNDRLIEWSKKYMVSYIDADYSNCYYTLKDKTTKTVEVLITNYQPKFETDWKLF